MRASSLTLVLILAKILTLAGRDVPASVWLPAAYFWHDVAVGLGFWVVDRTLGRPRAMSWPYYTIAVYAAINVPVTWALSSPLTVPMLRAAGAPLLDSVTHYLTAPNISAVALVVAASVVLPRSLPKVPARLRALGTVVALAIVLVGPFAARRVDTVGLHRNAVTTLLATAVPRIAERAAAGDFRASPFQERVGEDLTRLRGAAAGRNVVVVVLESTAARYLKFLGASDDPTPNLTALARESIVFERAYAVYPESIKGLFATMCSRFPAFDVPAEAHAATPCTSLAHVLGRSGYRTALFHSGRFMYLGMDAVLKNQGFDTLEDAGAIGGQVESSFGVDETSAVRRILAWIDSTPASRPFFVTYLPVAGHHPYVATTPGPFTDPGEFGAYKNAIYDGDRALGQLLDGLRKRQLDERTLVVIFGDHGEAFGQHDGNYAHTLFLYEENVHVPLVISGTAGGAGAAGARVTRVASVIDVTPTILDLLGLAPVAGHQGASLLAPRDRMALFYTDYALGWLGLRDGCWKYLFEVESRRSKLFDLCVDPNETQDLSSVHAPRVAAYRERVERWSSAQRAAILSER